jgi:replicative DNA helicase
MSATALIRPSRPTAKAIPTARLPATRRNQAVLGAILVNNDSRPGFLLPAARSFFEPVHAASEAAAALIRAGKLLQPGDAQDLFDNGATLGNRRSPYLARLAAGATTIINAEEYGRTVYELAQRRK